MKFDLKSEAFFLDLCKSKVEEKLGWGSSEQWSHADFLEVSEKISEATGINLSITTIKRLWGKVNYSGTPSGTTLNAIALYLGYENWRAFKQDQEEKALSHARPEQEIYNSNRLEKISEEKKQPFSSKRKKLLAPIVFTILLLTAAILFYSAKEKEEAPIAKGELTFNSEPLAKGIPNTVVFNYDLSALAFDSAFIQQDWDTRRREPISKENKQHTSVYYFPGHFKAKLVINDSVVKEHGILIPTEGWLGIVSRDDYPVPVYVKEDQMKEGGTLQVKPELLEAQKVDTGKDFGFTYANARNFGVEGDNFTLETAVKNDPEAGGKVCQEVMIFIDGEKGVIWFPLSAPGCVGNLSLNFGEVNVSGKNQDLSSFGADLSQWIKVKCTIKDKNVKLYYNDEMVYSLSYKQPIGNIMGVNLNFHGTGAVDYLRLRDAQQEIVFEDEFD